MLRAALLLVIALAVAMMTFDSAGGAADSAELCRELSELSHTRIVVIGDLHGDLDALGDVLEASGLVERGDRCEWKAGNSSMLVQLGDIVDRGPNSPGVTDCLGRLQSTAPRGNVVRLVGNHELMWAEGDYRFVSKTESGDVREKSVARWIRDVKEKRVKGAAAIGPLLFTHAGFRPAMLSRVGNIGKVTASALADFVDRSLLNAVEKGEFDADVFSAGPDRRGSGVGGPFWTDFSVLQQASSLPKGIIQVVGHSAARCKATQNARCEPVRARADLKAICVDAGLSEAYASNRAYLDIRGTTIIASTLGPESVWRHVDLAATSLQCGRVRDEEEEALL